MNQRFMPPPPPHAHVRPGNRAAHVGGTLPTHKVGSVTAAQSRGAGAARPSIPQEYSPPLRSNGGPRRASGATQGSGASPPPRVSGDTEVAPLQCGSIAAEFLPPQGRRQEWWRQCG